MSLHPTLRVLGLTLLAAVSWAAPARAWDSSELPYAPADGEIPGGGGIIGTGSQTDNSIQCADCHIDSEQRIDLSFTPSPAFENVGDVFFYQPDQLYEFTVTMSGETLGLSNCQPGGANANMFAATFEDENGTNVGVLQSDTGQRQGSDCPLTRPDPASITSGTTLLVTDCRVILTRDAFPDVVTWRFRWTAPPAGTGEVILYGGGVDSNCDMTSLGDDVKMVNLRMSDGSQRASLAPVTSDASRAALAAGVPSPEPLEWLALGAGALAFFAHRASRRRVVPDRAGSDQRRAKM